MNFTKPLYIALQFPIQHWTVDNIKIHANIADFKTIKEERYNIGRWKD